MEQLYYVSVSGEGGLQLRCGSVTYVVSSGGQGVGLRLAGSYLRSDEWFDRVELLSDRLFVL
jgi:hypothetical protein